MTDRDDRLLDKTLMWLWRSRTRGPVANEMNLHRWTLGSLLFLASFAAVMGPMNYARHLVSGPRLPFTAAYFGSLSLSLYFALGVSTERNGATSPQPLC